MREIVDQLLDSQALLEGIWESHSEGAVSSAEMLELASTLNRSQYIGLRRKGDVYILGEVEFAKESEAKVAASFAAKMGLKVEMVTSPAASEDELRAAWVMARPLQATREVATGKGAGAKQADIEAAVAALGLTPDTAFEAVTGTDGVSSDELVRDVRLAIKEFLPLPYAGSLPDAVARAMGFQRNVRPK
jgi:hypothetical protein